MKCSLIIFFILLLSSVVAADWMTDANNAVMDVDISSTITTLPLKPNAYVDYVQAEATFFPRADSRQTVLTQSVDPVPKRQDNTILFTWYKPPIGILSYTIQSKVRTKAGTYQVKEKVPFPLRDVPDEVKEFMGPTQNIDSDNPRIIRQASEIVSGESDGYVAVYKLAEWVETNVNYDLNTLTEDVSQKASWVLTNKEGVCDELTTLFIAFARSVGFPARFVSGLAFTNYGGLDNWGPHAWAEVYFPGTGWVPFDLTYRQFGDIDLSHVKLKESADSNESSTNYEWRSHNVDLDSSGLEMKVTLSSSNGEKEKGVGVDVSPLIQNVGYGSYNAVKVQVKNLDDYYSITSLYLSRVKEMTSLDEAKHIVLGPNEEKTVYYIVKVDENLDPAYVYTVPLTISSSSGEMSSSSFNVEEQFSVFKKQDVQSILGRLMAEEAKPISNNVSLSCTMPRILAGEPFSLPCEVQNLGNVLLDSLIVCLNGESCQTMNLGITQKTSVMLEGLIDSPGPAQVIVSADNEVVSKTHLLFLMVDDLPSMRVQMIDAPKKVKYHDTFDITMILNKTSMVSPKNVTIMMRRGQARYQWTIDQVDKAQPLVLEQKASSLYPGKNVYIVNIAYRDDESRVYTMDEEFSVELTDLTFLQKTVLFVKKFLRL
ncbi:transglutaminase domain-containing protein [Candidatus Woesearchaeota archaeon]|nr:MAG: hypothetical protein QS99_C0005G0059 [archaeon GW2011_AR4]MBS3129581.1 transglutaminase domain-containing protein [Candidatus Woesearchaeota archaeon]HIH37549.1 transglutaminase domain-containing protein [Candidatus Woesearchaeota archaeon]HIH49702.1 transglutaminase domain-containing protein [Candidatus Woesearchaeota archaeon]HIJ03196.1 transglutaminase domain-containing protein [Candidatus Woesearchaeota archaeon]